MDNLTLPAKAGTRPSTRVYRIEEFSDVMVDACLRDSEGRFLFLSIFGRDGALLQFVSALSLPRHQQGIERFQIVEGGHKHLVEVGGTERLDKLSGRLPKQNLFGPVSQMWLYDKALVTPDLVNRIGWVLQHGVDGAAQGDVLHARGWALVQRLSPVALLDPWRDAVMSWCLEAGIVRELNDPLYPPIGPISGLRVGLGQGFVTKISQMVRSRVLRLPTQGPDAEAPLVRQIAATAAWQPGVDRPGARALVVAS